MLLWHAYVEFCPFWLLFEPPMFWWCADWARGADGGRKSDRIRKSTDRKLVPWRQDIRHPILRPRKLRAKHASVRLANKMAWKRPRRRRRGNPIADTLHSILKQNVHFSIKKGENHVILLLIPWLIDSCHAAGVAGNADRVPSSRESSPHVHALRTLPRKRGVPRGSDRRVVDSSRRRTPSPSGASSATAQDLAQVQAPCTHCCWEAW